jgi:hypothetical protein
MSIQRIAPSSVAHSTWPLGCNKKSLRALMKAANKAENHSCATLMQPYPFLDHKQTRYTPGEARLQSITIVKGHSTFSKNVQRGRMCDLA